MPNAEGRGGEQLRGLGVADVFTKGGFDLADLVAAAARHLRPRAPEGSTN